MSEYGYCSNVNSLLPVELQIASAKPRVFAAAARPADSLAATAVAAAKSALLAAAMRLGPVSIKNMILLNHTST